MSNATPTEIGAVVSLWRYPVKSMLGEQVPAAQLTDHGPVLAHLREELEWFTVLARLC